MKFKDSCQPRTKSLQGRVTDLLFSHITGIYTYIYAVAYILFIIPASLCSLESIMYGFCPALNLSKSVDSNPGVIDAILSSRTLKKKNVSSDQKLWEHFQNTTFIIFKLQNKYC